MVGSRFSFDPSRIRISEAEILADLVYPAPTPLPRAGRRQPRQPLRRRAR